MTSSKQLMQRVVDAGGPLAKHVKELYIDYQPPEWHFALVSDVG